MPTQEDIDTGKRKALDSARIRYMTISLLLIAAHVGGFQLSDEIQLLGLKLAHAARPGMLYALVWVALAWMSFVYWQHYRESPDRCNEKAFIESFIRHHALQHLVGDKPSQEQQSVREVKVCPDFKTVEYRLHENADAGSPYEQCAVEAKLVRKYRRRAKSQLFRYNPEAIALRLPFLLAFIALVTTVVDYRLRLR